jgi:hypothetical protein
MFQCNTRIFTKKSIYKIKSHNLNISFVGGRHSYKRAANCWRRVARVQDGRRSTPEPSGSLAGLEEEWVDGHPAAGIRPRWPHN